MEASMQRFFYQTYFVWTTVDITPLISGNGSFNLALTSTNATAFRLARRESEAKTSQIVMETIL